MPEGPEVATYARYLCIHLKGLYITAIVKTGYSRNNDITIPNKLHKVLDVVSHGKKIFIITDDFVIQSSLIMCGEWSLQSNQYNRLYLERATYHSNTTSTWLVKLPPLYFNDKGGRFPAWLHVFTHAEYQKVRSKLGPCLLADKVDYELFSTLLYRYSDKPLYDIINEQTVIAGIGNYLRAEIMYAAKIRPDRLIGDITEDEMQLLYSETMRIIKLSYELEGCYVRDYQSPFGNASFQYHLKVYDEHKPGIVAQKFGKDTQTVYWCPAIQK